MCPHEIDAFADAAGIGEKNTVSNGPDDGANNLMAKCFWQCKRHGTTDQAVSNAGVAFAPEILSEFPDMYGSAGGLNIGGHGNEGVLETGMGQSGSFDVSKWIATWNEYHWGPIFDRIRSSSITMVSIWSCHTGAGSDGAELLYAIAKRCDRAVRARTGFTYTNGQKIWFENNSVWQVATPNNKPTPISAPTPHFRGEAVIEKNKRFFRSEQVQKVQFHHGPNSSSALMPLAIDGDESKEILDLLFGEFEMNLDIGVMGFITSQIICETDDGRRLEFDIYNDRIAVERESKIGYHIRGSISELMDTYNRSE